MRENNEGVAKCIADRFTDDQGDALFGDSKKTEKEALAEKPPETAQDNADKEYRVGDRGPAGGWIFFDKGCYTEGWRYLEAAPEDVPGEFFWGSDGNFETKPEIGKGKENTRKLAATSEATTISAFDCCNNYKLNGYDDWFLPSKNELNQMLGELHGNVLYAFKNGWYWSSSEHEYNFSTRFAYEQLSSSDSSYDRIRSDCGSVRPIRAF